MANERLRAALDAALGRLNEDALHYEHGHSSGGEPLDPDLFVNYKALRAALAAAPLPSEPETTFAWLIERGQPERQVPTVWWWLAAGGREGWTEVASEAFRFESREAAEEIITAKFTPLARARYGGPSARAVEHGFHRGAPLPSDTPADGLDVERLERALIQLERRVRAVRSGEMAALIAREYAALTPTQEAKGER